MPISDVLKGMRKEGYGSESPKKDSGSSEDRRTFQLTEEESKELQSYGEPGMEQECLVVGRVGPGGEFSVTSVRSPGEGDEESAMKSDSEEVMKKMRGPVMQMQTMPSPS